MDEESEEMERGESSNSARLNALLEGGGYERRMVMADSGTGRGEASFVSSRGLAAEVKGDEIETVRGEEGRA